VAVNLPEWVERLPTVNAILNGIAMVLLILGLILIKRNKRTAHKWTMLTAFLDSIVFLVCYLTYHLALRHYTGSSGKPFPTDNPLRPIYLCILLTHVVLAATVPILAMITIYRGLKADWERHRKIAHWTFPIWLYVSVTGVIIYGMLYHLADS